MKSTNGGKMMYTKTA